MRGDVQAANHCRAIIDKAVSEFGAIDILVNNAAHQASFKSIATPALTVFGLLVGCNCFSVAGAVTAGRLQTVS
jgi:NAD(P)-dependent dehydrogenase (short-subunit alcohol dehydrogenase family)